MSFGERLQKVLARRGAGSRRAAEELIKARRVSVDGKIVTALGTRVTAGQRIELDGKPVEEAQERRYFLLHKPAGFLTTVSDPHGRPTVMEFVEAEAPGLFPVGRLDLRSEGLLILTDDGELAYHLTHPSFHVPKTYRVLVVGSPTDSELARLADGVELDDGPTAPASVKRLSGEGSGTWVEITIHEGRKRQVRRMFETIGHPVRRLVRVSFGPVADTDLESGAIRKLAPAEVESLRTASSRRVAPGDEVV